MSMLEKSQAKEGTVLSGEVIEKSISPTELEAYVKNIVSQGQSSTFDMIFNDRVFETNSCILRRNGKWVFWHSARDEFSTWDWQEDLDALIKTCHDDMDLEDLNGNWRLFQGNQETDLLELFDEDDLVKLERFTRQQALPH